MATTGSLSRNQLLVRWLLSGWYVYATAVALVLLMALVVVPRTERFVAYWYDTTNPVVGAVTLAEQRREEWTHQAWVRIVAVPVGLLAFLHLFGLARVFRVTPAQEDKPEIPTVTGLKSSPVDVQELTAVRTAILPASPDVTASSDKTQVREALSLETVGERFIGPNSRYRVDHILGSGGMGSVFLGFDTSLKRKVALKSLHMELAQGDTDQIDRFRDEAYRLAGLSHPNIVPVYDLFPEGNEFWMAIELLEGGDLEQMIERKTLTIKQSVMIIRAVAKGLDHAHNRNFIHRDVKPMNIMFNGDKVPKLVDFGIAKGGESIQTAAKTQAGLSLGSPTYMSPEQATGKPDIDRRADIYSLGITFYKLLTGVVPFTGEITAVMRQHVMTAPQPPCEINKQISSQLNAIVMKMLEKEREARYQTLAEFIVDLDAYIKATT